MIYLNLIRQSNTVKLIMSSKAIAFAPFDGIKNTELTKGPRCEWMLI